MVVNQHNPKILSESDSEIRPIQEDRHDGLGICEGFWWRGKYMTKHACVSLVSTRAYLSLWVFPWLWERIHLPWKTARTRTGLRMQRLSRGLLQNLPFEWAAIRSGDSQGSTSRLRGWRQRCSVSLPSLHADWEYVVSPALKDFQTSVSACWNRARASVIVVGISHRLIFPFTDQLLPDNCTRTT